jgi:hypothetical protein
MVTTSVRLLTPIIVFMGEIPTNWFWLGGSVVIAGLLLMTVKHKRRYKGLITRPIAANFAPGGHGLTAR